MFAQRHHQQARAVPRHHEHDVSNGGGGERSLRGSSDRDAGKCALPRDAAQRWAALTASAFTRAVEREALAAIHETRRKGYGGRARDHADTTR